MFYIVFLLTNYLALGVGVWLAIRHGEMLRNEAAGKLQKKNMESALLAMKTMPQPPPAEFTEKKEQAKQTEQTEQNEPSIAGADSIHSFPIEEYSAGQNAKTEPLPEPLAESLAEEMAEIPEIAELPEPVEVAETQHQPLSSGEMIEQIEQMVGMISDDDADLKEIAAQMQEIRQEIHQQIYEAASTADSACYISEDAEAFITPDEKKYVTTAICRPIVGRK